MQLKSVKKFDWRESWQFVLKKNWASSKDSWNLLKSLKQRSDMITFALLKVTLSAEASRRVNSVNILEVVLIELGPL